MIQLLLALVLAAASAPQQPIKGRFCIAESKAVLSDGACRDVTGLTFEIAPAAAERLFLWTASDARTAQIGAVPADATRVALDSDERREVKLALRGEASRGWPLDVRILVGARKYAWRFTVPAGSASRLERLIVPAGSYVLEIRADRHRPLRARIDGTKAAHDLSRLRLEPLPRVRGIVGDAEQKPIAYSTVTLPDGSLCTTADEQGAFTCELPERTPEVVAINATGYGTREIKIERSRSDIDLGTIELSKGQPLTVRISRDAADTERVKVMLLSDLPDRYEHSRLKTEELENGQERIRFEDLSPGRYLVVLSGTQPLERLTVPVEIKAGEETATDVTLEPFRLDAVVFFGDEPLRQGRLTVTDREHGWREEINLTEDGTFGGTMWQKGVVSGIVTLARGMIPEFLSSPTLGADPSHWEIRIKKREIVGRIVDAASRQPVAKASIHMVADLERLPNEQGGGNSRRLQGTVTVGPDSSFRILANRPGNYELTVNAPEYTTKIVKVVVGAEDTSKTIDVAMEAGVEQPLEIVSSSGSPIPNVAILEGVQNEVNPQFILKADSEGKFALRGRPGDVRTLYFVPREGSFAIARIRIPSLSGSVKPQQVVVPPVAGAIRVRALDPDDNPVPTRIIFRYNGEFMPPAIIRFVTERVLGTDRSGVGLLSRLPAGAYEVWAVGSFADEQQLIGSNGTLRPPERVGLSAGEASVTVRAPKLNERR